MVGDIGCAGSTMIGDWTANRSAGITGRGGARSLQRPDFAGK
jgi:hypothetical protein